jgi:hypothetical protein
LRIVFGTAFAFLIPMASFIRGGRWHIMKSKRLHFRKNLLAVSALSSLFWLGVPVHAQSASPQSNAPAQQDDITRQELARFDQFLDDHRDIGIELRKDPSLVDNREYVDNHPDLKTFLQDHPRVREEIKANPDEFMRREERFERREDARDDRDRDTDRNADRDRDRDANRDNDMNRDRDANRGDDPGRDRDRDANREELANFDRFLDNHREIAEQLRKDPSLADNPEFLRNHPALQTYLQQHPGVRDELKQNPNAFMREEDRFDRRDDHHFRDPLEERRANFGEFLGGHANISEQLSKDPTLVKNDEYLTNHPELREYLKSHPDVQQDLMANPQDFVKSAQQFNSNNTGKGVKTTAPTPDPKPKQ